MDLSFILANLVAVAVKALWFSRDTRARDIVLPILVFVANLTAQLVSALSAPQEAVTGAVVTQALTQTALSLATYQGLGWAKAIVGGK